MSVRGDTVSLRGVTVGREPAGGWPYCPSLSKPVAAGREACTVGSDTGYQVIRRARQGQGGEGRRALRRRLPRGHTTQRGDSNGGPERHLMSSLDAVLISFRMTQFGMKAKGLLLAAPRTPGAVLSGGGWLGR